MASLSQLLEPYIPGCGVRYRYDYESDRIFLYRVLEERTWGALTRLKVTSSDAEGARRVIGELIGSEPDLGWLSLSDAVTKHDFIPAGFQRAPVLDENQKLIGHTLVTYGAGLAFPWVIQEKADWVNLIRHILGAPYSGPENSDSMRNENGFIAGEALDGSCKFRLVRIKGMALEPASEITRYRKPVDLLSSPPDDTPLWATRELLELDPLKEWDEGTSNITALLDGIPGNDARDQHGLQALKAGYSRNEAPTLLSHLWVELGKSVVEDELTDLDAIIPKIFNLPTLPASGMLLDNLFETAEAEGVNGFKEELKRSVTREGLDRVLRREKQVRDSRGFYPELDRFSNEALTFWWRRYIHDMGQPSVDVADDHRYQIQARSPDKGFLLYLALQSTKNYGDLRYVFAQAHDNLVKAMLDARGIERDLEQRVRASVILLGELIERLGPEEVPEVVQEAREHITRLLEVSVLSAVVSDLCFGYQEVGPALFSLHDHIICDQRDFQTRYELPSE